MERWRPIKGFEGRYSVSSKGRIRNDRRGSILSPRENEEGYSRAALFKEGKYFHRLTHRLVAEAFISNPEGHPIVLHGINGVSDNSVENLKWGTPEENQRDRVRDGTDTRTNKTHCVNGHRYTEETTYWNPKTGSRSCKICRAEHTARYDKIRTDRKRGPNNV